MKKRTDNDHSETVNFITGCVYILLWFVTVFFLGEIPLEKSFSFVPLHSKMFMRYWYAPGSQAALAIGTQIIRWPVTTTIWPLTSKRDHIALTKAQ